MPAKLDLKLRLWRDDDIAFGPGKADLLDAIAQTGSISAAARSLGMSYRRAWLLVDAMNRSFAQPLVVTLAGGKQGGGAQVTDQGQLVLKLYRAMQRKAAAAIAREVESMTRLLQNFNEG